MTLIVLALCPFGFLPNWCWGITQKQTSYGTNWKNKSITLAAPLFILLSHSFGGASGYTAYDLGEVATTVTSSSTVFGINGSFIISFASLSDTPSSHFLFSWLASLIRWSSPANLHLLLCITYGQPAIVGTLIILVLYLRPDWATHSFPNEFSHLQGQGMVTGNADHFSPFSPLPTCAFAFQLLCVLQAVWWHDLLPTVLHTSLLIRRPVQHEFHW